MSWSVYPFSHIGGATLGGNYLTYGRYPPANIRVLVVGGGGNGGPAGGGGGGGVIDVDYATGLIESDNTATYPIVVGGAGGTSYFINTSYQATGGNSSTGGDLTGGTGGSPNGYGGGLAGINDTCGTNRLGWGGGGGAWSGGGGSPQRIGNDKYEALGAYGYTVSGGVSNALGGMYVLASGGGGGTFVGGAYQNWCTFCTSQIRTGGTQPGAGTGRYCGNGATNGSWYGTGGGGGGGAGQQGVVVISYAGTQATSGGTVSSYGGSTYHTFTSDGSIQF